MWDPRQYERFAHQRAQPFYDLLARVDLPDARVIVDLGCGPGRLTAELARRWPEATVLGVDSSPEMLDAALPRTIAGRLEFRLADLRKFEPDRPIDLIVSNASLQWVPDHLGLVARLAGQLAPHGVLAFQVPGNFGEPSHRLLSDLAATPRWRGALASAPDAGPGAHEPDEYLQALLGAGLDPIVFATTYYLLLGGDNPVLEWMKGTALRPALAALGPDSGEFLGAYGAALEQAYPREEHGTVLPYRRIFAVGRQIAPPGTTASSPSANTTSSLTHRRP